MNTLKKSRAGEPEPEPEPGVFGTLEPEPEPLEKKGRSRSQSWKKICWLPSPDSPSFYVTGVESSKDTSGDWTKWIIVLPSNCTSGVEYRYPWWLNKVKYSPSFLLSWQVESSPYTNWWLEKVYPIPYFLLSWLKYILVLFKLLYFFFFFFQSSKDKYHPQL